MIEVHDDVPEWFDMMLQYVYNNDYDQDAIEALNSNGDSESKGIALFDKYGMCTLVEEAEEHLYTLLYDANDFAIFKAAIHEHYESNPDPNTSMGKLITSTLVECQPKYLDTEDLEILTLSYRTFVMDMFLALKRHGQLGLVKVKCHGAWDACGCNNWVNVQESRDSGRTSFVCAWCSESQGLPQ